MRGVTSPRDPHASDAAQSNINQGDAFAHGGPIQPGGPTGQKPDRSELWRRFRLLYFGGAVSALMLGAVALLMIPRGGDSSPSQDDANAELAHLAAAIRAAGKIEDGWPIAVEAVGDRYGITLPSGTLMSTERNEDFGWGGYVLTKPDNKPSDYDDDVLWCVWITTDSGSTHAYSTRSNAAFGVKGNCDDVS